jgi:hypothetical protein
MLDDYISFYLGEVRTLFPSDATGKTWVFCSHTGRQLQKSSELPILQEIIKNNLGRNITLRDLRRSLVVNMNAAGGKRFMPGLARGMAHSLDVQEHHYNRPDLHNEQVNNIIPVRFIHVSFRSNYLERLTA